MKNLQHERERETEGGGAEGGRWSKIETVKEKKRESYRILHSNKTERKAERIGERERENWEQFFPFLYLSFEFFQALAHTILLSLSLSLSLVRALDFFKI